MTDRAAWARVKALFDELVDLEPAARAARLAALAGEDAALHAELERLLAADAAPDARLDALVTAVGAQATGPVDALGLAGRTLAHFRVVEPLDRGGMGVLYRAVDTRLGRHVALKLPLPALAADASGKQRFLHEARSIAALDHPNVCSVYEVGESEEGHPFLAMALYPGETLRARLARVGALPAGEALEIARQVALGLGAAHRAGVVHRDLKPGNVMLLPDGGVRILDFGLAKVRDLDLTDPGTRPGTVAYMAPEQVRGEPVDARTDLWALGVVLYEMLGGRRPFVGEHDLSVAQAILHTEPPRLGGAAGEVPGPAAALVRALLRKAPSARPASADEVAAAIAAVQRGQRPALPGRGRRVALLGAAAGVALVAGAWLARGDGGAAPAGDAALIAVAPFDVLDPSLRLWGEGMMDILSRDLDGAGPLRTVPQSVALRRWAGRADPASAEAFARRTGAGLVVFGSVVRTGADSVRVRATLLDRRDGVVARDLEVAGAEDRMGAITDSLGLLVVRTLGRERSIGAVAGVSMGSRSLPALKAFLRGEQFYRRGQWDSALAAYDEATRRDTTFGLPLRRMYRVLGWAPLTRDRYPDADSYRRRWEAHGEGLSARDRLLFVADSLFASAESAPTAEVLLAARDGVLATLETAVRRYPDDPESWYEYGEVLLHRAPPHGHQPEEALRAFDRAIALDPGFIPSYQHVVELAVRLRQPARARDYARRWAAALDPSDATVPKVRLLRSVMDSTDAAGTAGRARTATVAALYFVGAEHLAWLTDPQEVAIAVLRELADAPHPAGGAPAQMEDPAFRRQLLASALAFRGHLRESAAELQRIGRPPDRWRGINAFDPFAELAVLGALPDSAVRRTFALALEAGVPWGAGRSLLVPRHLRGLEWWLEHGDTASLARVAARAAALGRGGATAAVTVRAWHVERVAAAYLALARADTAAAIAALRAIPEAYCVAAACAPEKLRLARLLAATGASREAATVLDRWIGASGATPTAVLGMLERGALAERLGERDKALECYRFVAEAWASADPALAPHVARARDGLRRLGGPPS